MTSRDLKIYLLEATESFEYNGEQSHTSKIDLRNRIIIIHIYYLNEIYSYVYLYSKNAFASRPNKKKRRRMIARGENIIICTRQNVNPRLPIYIIIIIIICNIIIVQSHCDFIRRLNRSENVGVHTYTPVSIIII